MDSLFRKQFDSHPLVYRSKLTIPRKVNFGLEIELDKVDYNEVYSLVRQSNVGDWIVKRDKSLTDGRNAELVSPVLQNTKDTWIMLKEMAEMIKQIDASYNKCSFQVNLDGSLLPSDADKVRFLKLWAFYEDILYRFFKGEDSEYRDSIDRFASPIILTLKSLGSFSDRGIVDMFSDNKRYGVVFKTRDVNLIELRGPNMTDNPILWQNYVSTFYYLLKCSTGYGYDKKEVDSYIDKFFKSYVLESYEVEKEDKAMQFVKKIFPHNSDRISFMHQYLKR